MMIASALRFFASFKLEKRGIMPWVPILSEMETPLRQMQKRTASHLLFPSPFEPEKPRDDSVVRHRIRPGSFPFSK